MDKEQYFKTYFQKAVDCVTQLKEKLKGVVIHSALDKEIQAQENYFLAAQVFNTRLQQNPLAIVYCKTAQNVSDAYLIAIANEIPIRVRAGGHDHEGESSGTNVVVIDVSAMTDITIDKTAGIAKIGAGCRFNYLTAELAKQNVMIAHGTCATVCITGFTLGGGWGPWTRKMGMNCEHLVGVTLVLGDGKIIEIDDKNDGWFGQMPGSDALLWALRGGGGMSYGIVTELRLKTFELPKELIKFELHWNHYDDKEEYPKDEVATLKILQAWEEIIESPDTSKLIGTNLKINARPEVANFNYEEITHSCCMYGYWEGNEADFINFVDKSFEKVPPPVIKIDGEGGESPENPQERYIKGKGMASNWDRESSAQVQAKLAPKGLLKGEPIPPDEDDPAPHKITSRLVNSGGLKEGYKQFLLSLTSPLVLPKNRSMGLFTYVTLGAIVGDYYKQITEKKAQNSAFPYKDKLYTIQYQAWWNESDKNHQYPAPSQSKPVYENINRAMDWIDAARTFDIPNTSGAFISFKDSSIPASVYFDKNYEQLRYIKEQLSRDPFNHLRTRKTIL